jgi:hypothetical protein
MSHSQSNHDSKSVFKEWLEKLQQESWQLELLISGFAIFGIYSARSLITDFYFFRENEAIGEIGLFIGLVGFIFKTGWLIFFMNLLVHVILRGLWIGAIGLRYVSQEIDYDSLGYSERFTSFLKEKVGSYDDFIERLEKICSVLFAYTFLLFLLFTSLMIFILQTILIVMIGVKINPNNEILITLIGLFGTVYFILGGFVFVDLVSLGGFKKIKEKHISTLYYYLYRYYSVVTLSFLYRPLLYNFIDNAYTRKLFYLSIPYIFLMIAGNTILENNPNPYLPDRNTLISNGNLLDDYYYDDLRNIKLQEYPNEDRKINKQKLKWISLEKFNITEPVSSIFIKTDDNLIKLLEKDTSISPYEKKGLSIRWFNFNGLSDKKISDIEKMKSAELADLYEKKRTLNKEFKKNKNTSIQSKIDSIEARIDQKIAFWNVKIKDEKMSKVDRVLKSYTSNLKFYIDSVNIPLDKCYFYTHPHYQEQGLRCFFNTDSIPKGLHNVIFVRNFYNNTEEIVKDSINLPIIKH